MKVLIIEDEVNTGKGIQMLVNGHGLTAVWVIGLREENAFEGGMIHAYTHPDWEPVVLDPSEFALALVDGDLPGDGPQGYEIIPKLREVSRIICVGISANVDSARKQQEGGAHDMQMKPIPKGWISENFPRLLKMYEEGAGN